MRQSFYGFSQAKLIEHGIDITDTILLDYIIRACGSPKMHHKLDSNGKPQVWIYHEKLMEDLPILNITEGTLKNRLSSLRQRGFIQSTVVANEGKRGTHTYYGITELTESLMNDEVETTTSFSNDLKTRPRHFKMTSDNLLQKDNKENNISKDMLTPTEKTDTEISTTDTVKPKKENLYQKCYRLIEEYTEDEKLRDILDSYLRMRLAMKDKPLYGVNQFRGILNKLSVLGGDPFEIVSFCIERGYASFYAPSGNYNSNSKSKNKKFSQTDKISSEKVTQEEIDNGYFTGEIV